MKGVIYDGMPEVDVMEMNHDVDHVHMLLSIPPKMSMSGVVRRIKSVIGQLLKQKFEYMRKAYLRRGRDMVRWIFCFHGWIE
jgi:putative transposase